VHETNVYGCVSEASLGWFTVTWSVRYMIIMSGDNVVQQRNPLVYLSFHEVWSRQDIQRESLPHRKAGYHCSSFPTLRSPLVMRPPRPDMQSLHRQTARPVDEHIPGESTQLSGRTPPKNGNTWRCSENEKMPRRILRVNRQSLLRLLARNFHYQSENDRQITFRDHRDTDFDS
jgi:hypothetical protein